MLILILVCITRKMIILELNLYSGNLITFSIFLNMDCFASDSQKLGTIRIFNKQTALLARLIPDKNLLYLFVVLLFQDLEIDSTTSRYTKHLIMV